MTDPEGSRSACADPARTPLLAAAAAHTVRTERGFARGGGATTVAAAAVLDVVIDRGLTAVRDVAVTIAEAEIARDRADPLHAARLRVLARAGLLAGAAVIRVAVQIRLAAVRGLSVAIGVRRFAGCYGAHALSASRFGVLERADCATRAAVPRVTGGCHLTLDVQVPVAFGAAKAA